MNIQNYLWLLPFCGFILGYGIAQKMCSIQPTHTPLLIGMSVHEALPMVAQHKLTLQLIDHKEELHIPEGIIVSQTPSAQTTIKPHQPIFIVTTKKPATQKAPECMQHHIGDLTDLFESKSIRARVSSINHSYPTGMCFAQYPQAGEPLENNTLIVYISAGNNSPIIWPNLIGSSIENVMPFLHEYGIQPYIINDASCSEKSMELSTIVEQRPLPGTLITLDEKSILSVQLRIR